MIDSKFLDKVIAAVGPWHQLMTRALRIHRAIAEVLEPFIPTAVELEKLRAHAVAMVSNATIEVTGPDLRPKQRGERR
jgi:hypothetical protein